MRLTFTGVDDRTDLSELAACCRSTGIEYAVLAGTSTGRHPRFPQVTRIRAFEAACSDAGIACAIHLCGRHARAANAGEHEELTELCRGFGRIQVNSPTAGDYNRENLEQLQEHVGVPVIVQHRQPFTDSKPFAGRKLSYLFDKSGGRGVAGFEYWSRPWPGIACGYAGGLNPENIAAAITHARSFNQNVWLDMETGIRTEDRFDVQKVQRISETAQTMNAFGDTVWATPTVKP